MFRIIFYRSFAIHNQICLDLIKNTVHSSSRWYSFLNHVKPSIRYTSSHLQFCTDIHNDFNFEKRTAKMKIPITPIIIDLMKNLNCTESEAIFAYQFLSKRANQIDLKSINKTAKWLHKLGAETPIIVRNCHLFLVPLGKKLNLRFHLKNKKKSFKYTFFIYFYLNHFFL